MTVVLALLGPLIWAFGGLFSGQRICAYRDTTHFYYPLYAWISQCWSRGELPLWNPQENMGVPVMAEATSAVFYPAQLIFTIPLPYPFKFNLYLLSHFLLAALGAYVLARRLLATRDPAFCQEEASLGGRGPTNPADSGNERPDQGGTRSLSCLAAGLCGASYAFGGVVLFQYCNVVFLVGAAWLPFALLAADRMFSSHRFSWSVMLGVCLALMVLGGDPQMAYNTVLLSALLGVLGPYGLGSPAVSPDGPARPAPPARRPRALLMLAGAVVIGVSLSAVQVFPSLSVAFGSDRAATHGSESLVERLFFSPPRGTHQERIYDFSVAPWRVMECLWPNVSGQMFPVNRRWLSALRAEGRIWTPTLYLGLMPLLFALMMWRVRTRDGHVRWLSLVMCGALLASFGWYGLGWLAGELQRLLTGAAASIPVDEPVGGIYWFMVKFLPGYAYFRYPAKLLVVASLATSLLAGLGMERALARDRRRIVKLLVVVGTVSAVAVTVVGSLRACWSPWFAEACPDALFGPLDEIGAWRGCMLACAQTTVLCVVFWWLLRRSGWSPVFLGQLVLLVTVAEIAWANGLHVATAPVSALSTPIVLAKSTRRAGSTRSSCVTRIYRSPRRRWVPRQWRETSSRNRCEQVVRWDRATLFPKYQLLGEFGSVRTFRTIGSRDYRALMRIGGHRRPRHRVLDLVGVRFLVLPEQETWPEGTPVTRDRAQVENVRVWRNRRPLPRAWVVHKVDVWTPEDSSDLLAVERRLQRLLSREQSPRDLRTEAVVESPSPFPVAAKDDRPDVCQVVAERGARLEIKATLASPGLLVLNNHYDPGWSVEVSSGSSSSRHDVVRTNVVMQGVFLPEGTHRLVFRYTPRGFHVAAGISISSWLLCAAFAMRHRVTRRRTRWNGLCTAR